MIQTFILVLAFSGNAAVIATYPNDASCNAAGKVALQQFWASRPGAGTPFTFLCVPHSTGDAPKQ
jgi:hypothetical protein